MTSTQSRSRMTSTQSEPDMVRFPNLNQTRGLLRIFLEGLEVLLDASASARSSATLPPFSLYRMCSQAVEQRSGLPPNWPCSSASFPLLPLLDPWQLLQSSVSQPSLPPSPPYPSALVAWLARLGRKEGRKEGMKEGYGEPEPLSLSLDDRCPDHRAPY